MSFIKWPRLRREVHLSVWFLVVCMNELSASPRCITPRGAGRPPEGAYPPLCTCVDLDARTQRTDRAGAGSRLLVGAG